VLQNTSVLARKDLMNRIESIIASVSDGLPWSLDAVTTVLDENDTTPFAESLHFTKLGLTTSEIVDRENAEYILPRQFAFEAGQVEMESVVDRIEPVRDPECDERVEDPRALEWGMADVRREQNPGLSSRPGLTKKVCEAVSRASAELPMADEVLCIGRLFFDAHGSADSNFLRSRERCSITLSGEFHIMTSTIESIGTCSYPRGS